MQQWCEIQICSMMASEKLSGDYDVIGSQNPYFLEVVRRGIEEAKFESFHSYLERTSGEAR